MSTNHFEGSCLVKFIAIWVMPPKKSRKSFETKHDGRWRGLCLSGGASVLGWVIERRLVKPPKYENIEPFSCV